MKIGIIGAGAIGQLYGRLWLTAGHDIMLSSRHPEKIRWNTPQLPEMTVGTSAEAATFGDVILLAANYDSLDVALESIQKLVTDKLVIDATNPLVYVEGGGTKRVIADDEIAGVQMAKRLPEARIAKAFTSLWTGYVEQHSNISNPTIAMPLAADQAGDRELVASLVREAGLVPVVLGSLAQSRPLDPPSSIWNVVLSEDELNQRVASFRADLAASS